MNTISKLAATIAASALAVTGVATTADASTQNVHITSDQAAQLYGCHPLEATNGVVYRPALPLSPKIGTVVRRVSEDKSINVRSAHPRTHRDAYAMNTGVVGLICAGDLPWSVRVDF